MIGRTHGTFRLLIMEDMSVLCQNPKFSIHTDGFSVISQKIRNEKEDLKIVFFGTPEFAVTSLAKLVDEGYNVSAVVTMPDKEAGRGRKIIQSDVKKYAVEKGLEVLQPEKLKAPEFIDKLREINADLFIVIAFRMLPEVVWTMPRLGTFQPAWIPASEIQGAAPINRAIMNGETETGVTTFFSQT